MSLELNTVGDGAPAGDRLWVISRLCVISLVPGLQFPWEPKGKMSGGFLFTVPEVGEAAFGVINLRLKALTGKI